MIWVRFVLKDAPDQPVFVKLADGRDVDVLDLADKRFGFNGTEEQRRARAHRCDEMLERRKQEKRG